MLALVFQVELQDLVQELAVVEDLEEVPVKDLDWAQV